ncbi:MAG: hypothetical protein QNJ84_10490 [Alphaproteobacteria bacterium]|nr:hypothetical protein [Alphaproteobacteria bacterium]
MVQIANRQAPHAAPLVELVGEILLRDTWISVVATPNRGTRYAPIYTINETAWRLHRS